MTTHTTHHIQTRQGKDAAMRWLAQQLRWERLLDDLRTPDRPNGQEEEAA